MPNRLIRCKDGVYKGNLIRKDGVSYLCAYSGCSKKSATWVEAKYIVGFTTDMFIEKGPLTGPMKNSLERYFNKYLPTI